MEFLELYDLSYNKICILTDNTANSVYDIREENKLNGIDTLSFTIPLTSDKWQNIINENLVKWKDEYYFIRTPMFSHNTDTKSLSVDCEHLSSSLQAIQNPILKEVGKTARELMEIILGTNESGTSSSCGWIIGTIDIPNNIYRAIETSEQSIFTNLVKVAELFDARLRFNSESRTIDLFQNDIDRNIQIRKGKNLQSIDLTYDTSELATRMYAFGANDEVTGEPINVMTINPTGKSYIENYDFFIGQGYTLDYIQQHPELFLRETTWSASEYVDRQQLYDDAVDKLSKISQPKITCSVEGLNLEMFPQYFALSPILGEKVYIIDLDLNLFVQARVISVKRESGKPLSTRIDISNEIAYSSVLKQLVDSSKAVNKVITPSQQILGQYVKEATIGNAQIKNASITSAKIENAQILNAHIKDGEIDSLKIGTGQVKNINIENGTIENAKIKDGTIETAKINQAWVNNLNANMATVGTLDADVGHIKNVFSDVLTAGQIVAGSSVIAEGAIGNAHISSLNADKLDAGTVDTSKVTIQGQNAKMKLTGNRLQVFDQTAQGVAYERVSLGDVNGDGTVYGFRVRGADGTTVLLDETGVKEEGITNGAITNAKISDNANIDGSKLDIATVVTEINNGTTNITGSKIQLTDKTLDVKISEITNTQTSQGSSIANNTSSINQLSSAIDLKVSTQTFDQTINDIQDNIVYKVDIISTNGGVFKNGQISTTLMARVYHGSEDVTDTIDANRFRWTRVSSDTAGDTAWNTSHFGGTKQISVTNADVNVRATFNCEILDVV